MIDLDAAKARLACYRNAIGPGGDKAWWAGQLARLVPDLIDEVDRLRAQLAAIRDLHTESTAGPYVPDAAPTSPTESQTP